MDRGKVTFGVIGVVVILAIAVFAAYQAAKLWAKEEIHRVELEREVVRAERDSILAVTSLRDSFKLVTQRTIDSIAVATSDIRRFVDSAEQARATEQLNVRLLRTNDATEREVREVFPEFSNAMRVTEDLSDPEFPIRYIGFPVQFAQAFIIYRQNAEAFEEQRDSLAMLDTLNLEIIALKDSVITLTELNEATFRVGFDSAFARYEQRTTEYIDLLNQPRFKLDVPALSVILGSIAVGALVGVAVSN